MWMTIVAHKECLREYCLSWRNMGFDTCWSFLHRECVNLHLNGNKTISGELLRLKTQIKSTKTSRHGGSNDLNPLGIARFSKAPVPPILSWVSFVFDNICCILKWVSATEDYVGLVESELSFNDRFANCSVCNLHLKILPNSREHHQNQHCQPIFSTWWCNRPHQRAIITISPPLPWQHCRLTIWI